MIDPAFDEVFRTAPGRIIIASFASLISRMQQVGNAAMRYDRKMAFAGTSMVENAKIARKLGYLDLPDELVVSIDQALKMDPEKVVLMSTGTQGEPTSIMGRLSTGTNRQFDIIPGDTVVLSSHPIPGNEESVYRTINRLFRRGANVIYENIAPVHVSGHASQEEMKLLLHLVQPKYFIPIHGELRHLHQHAHIAQQVGIPADRVQVIENGQVVEFDNGEMSLGERIPGGYVFVDGAGVGDVGPSVLREREMIARDGFVLVNLTLDGETKHLLEDPEIITRGFIYTRNGDELLEETSQFVSELGARQPQRQPAERHRAVAQIVPVQPHPAAADDLRYLEPGIAIRRYETNREAVKGSRFLLFLPAEIPFQRHKGHRNDDLGFEILAFALQALQSLVTTPSDRNYQQACIHQLLEQRTWNLGRGGGHDNTVVGRIFRPTTRAIPNMKIHILQPNLPDGCFSLARQWGDAFHRIHFVRQVRQNRRLVAGPGANLKHLLTALQIQKLGHQCHDIGLGNCLLAANRQRAVGVSMHGILRSDKQVARDGAHGFQYTQVADIAPEQMLVHHAVALFFKIQAGLHCRAPLLSKTWSILLPEAPSKSYRVARG